MPGEVPTAEDFERTIEDLLAPLREQVALIDDELATLDARKRELREVRAKAARIIGANSKPGPKSKPKPGARAGHKSTASAERTAELLDYLRATFNSDEFSTLDLRDRADFKPLGMASAYYQHALAALHDQGALQLVRIGLGPGSGPGGNRTKVWKVTSK